MITKEERNEKSLRKTLRIGQFRPVLFVVFCSRYPETQSNKGEGSPGTVSNELRSVVVRGIFGYISGNI